MFDFVINDDWRVRLMDRTYRTLAEKVKAPDYAAFSMAMSDAWAGVIEGIEWRFYTGIQWALTPPVPEDPALWDQWEDANFDQRGQPALLYDPDFERRFFEVLVEYDEVDDKKTARLHCRLADRYARRGEWMKRLMADMWLELPVLPEAEIKAFYDERRQQGQLSLLGALGWE